jgi:hypothetical protein
LKHKAHPDFWFHYRQLAPEVRALADKNFTLLKTNPRHSSLQLKKVGADVYSARVGLEHRALAFETGGHFVWFWIGPHDEYDRLIS